MRQPQAVPPHQQVVSVHQVPAHSISEERVATQEVAVDGSPAWEMPTENVFEASVAAIHSAPAISFATQADSDMDVQATVLDRPSSTSKSVAGSSV